MVQLVVLLSSVSKAFATKCLQSSALLLAAPGTIIIGKFQRRYDGCESIGSAQAMHFWNGPGNPYQATASQQNSLWKDARIGVVLAWSLVSLMADEVQVLWPFAQELMP
jgi:hypothetical protein